MKTQSLPDLYDASIRDLQDGLDRGHFSSVDLVNAYVARINEVNLKGPGLRAVLEINPSALKVASTLDEERSHGHKRSEGLHGIPILIKDNISTDAEEGLNTTAGSYALVGSHPAGDSRAVEKLRGAGAIILGKTNCDEWSGARVFAPGWSGRGGQTTNPYYPYGDPGGSSSGSAVGTAIGLAAAAFGTETHCSITCPSHLNNVVGLKPTKGLISTSGVIPVSTRADSVGPIARSVVDAAILLTHAAESNVNYIEGLSIGAVRNKRVGVPRRLFAPLALSSPAQYAAFDDALDILRRLGVTVVDPADLSRTKELLEGEEETIALLSEFKIAINDYLPTLKYVPTGVRCLQDLIDFNVAHPELERPTNYTDQTSFIRSQETEGATPKLRRIQNYLFEIGAKNGIDEALHKYQLDALVIPMNGLAMTPASVSAYPAITVPLGFRPPSTEPQPYGPTTFNPAPNLPFGLAFMSTANSEATLLSLAYAFEQESKVRLRGKKAYAEAIPKTQLRDVIPLRIGSSRT